MAERIRDLRDCLTAYECRDRLPELARWADEDTLKQLTIWRGSRFASGETYFDLDNPGRGPFVATGDEGRPVDYTYVAKAEVTEPAWAALIAWGVPVTPDQAEALTAQAAMFAPASPQSAAGDAREPRQGGPLVDPAHRGQRRSGTIARLVPDRGFGFIAGDDGGEFFFQRYALQGVDFESLSPGIPVTFAIGGGPGDQPGEHPRAVSVRSEAV